VGGSRFLARETVGSGAGGDHNLWEGNSIELRLMEILMKEF
jgi:hypothetical protein